ncbi:MAG: Fe-S cluster assembly protein IscX [Vibrionaceae bacterium]
MSITLKWVDTQEIAIALCDKFPQVDPSTVRFTQLQQWVMELDGFADDPKHCNEKILESILMHWLGEQDDF